MKMLKGLLTVLLAGAITVSAGCDLFGTKKATPAPERNRMSQTGKRMSQTAKRNSQAPTGRSINYRRPMGAPMPAPETTGNKSTMKSTRTRIRTACENVQGVDSANVVVVDTTRTAVVGLELEKGRTPAQSRRIIAECKRKAKAMPRVTNAYVTADPDLVTRIRNMAGGIAKGKPLSSFRSELDQIVSRLR